MLRPKFRNAPTSLDIGEIRWLLQSNLFLPSNAILSRLGPGVCPLVVPRVRPLLALNPALSPHDDHMYVASGKDCISPGFTDKSSSLAARMFGEDSRMFLASEDACKTIELTTQIRTWSWG